MGGRSVRGDRGWDVRARHLDVAATARTGRHHEAGLDPGAADGCPGAASPAGAGRQGGDRLERTGHRRPGRARGPHRCGRVAGRRPIRCRTAGPDALDRGPAAAGLPARVAGRHAGVLEDYGDLAEGLLALHQATAEGRWLDLAGDLLDVVVEQFVDVDGWHDTAADAETLVSRPFDPTDGPTPAGIAAAAGAAVSYGALAGSPRHRELGEAALALLGRLVDRAPRVAGWAAAVGEALLAGPLEVAVSGPAGPEREALAATARASTSPGAVVVVGEPDAAGVPLLAGRPLVGGAPAAYVCRGFVCSAPVTDASALSAAMRPTGA